MRPRRLALLGVAVVLLLGCHGHHEHEHGGDDHGDHGHGHEAAGERPVLSFTRHGSQTELFVEFPALAVGEASPFAAHLTNLADFTPLAAGRVAVLLTAPDGTVERFETSTASVPGIFRPVATPATAGERLLAVEVETGAGVERHLLGPLTVAADATAVVAPAADPEPQVVFLKEQQWRTEFATAPVGERAFRPSVVANGALTTRAEGEALVVAPAAGRLLAHGVPFPRLGIEVQRDQMLAEIAPRLGADADLASLELAVREATIADEHAQRERRRLESLFADQVVPERRVVEARHDAARAEAALTAARRRLEQFRGTQRIGAGGSASVIAVRAPIAGTVAAVGAAPGAFVEEGAVLFHLVDLDRLWLQVQIPEAEVNRVRQASAAWFTVDGFAEPFAVDAEHGGAVIALGGVVDPRTRTVPLVFELDNPEGALRVGMFARVHVVIGPPETGLAVPAAAVLDEGGQPVAYVQTSGEGFARRPLRLGIRDGDWIQVRDGVAAGERVVTRGAYQVRLAAAGDAVPAHGHAH